MQSILTTRPLSYLLCLSRCSRRYNRSNDLTSDIISTSASDEIPEMVSVRMFIEFVKNKDIDRIKLAIRELHYDINSQDELGRTGLHHAVLDGIIENDLQMVQKLIDLGADVNVKDDTNQRETALHICLRLGHIDATKLIIQSPSFDVVASGAYQRKKMFTECATVDTTSGSRLASRLASRRSNTSNSSSRSNNDDINIYYVTPPFSAPASDVSGGGGGVGESSGGGACSSYAGDEEGSYTLDENCCTTRRLSGCSSLVVGGEIRGIVEHDGEAVDGDGGPEAEGDRRMLFVRRDVEDYLTNNFTSGYDEQTISELIIVQNDAWSASASSSSGSGHLSLEHVLHRISYSTLTSLCIVDCTLDLRPDCDVFQGLSLHSLVLSMTRLRNLPRSIYRMDRLEILHVSMNSLEEISSDIGSLTSLTSFACDRQSPRPLRSLPQTIRHLTRLKTLSFTGNRIESIAWISSLSSLKVLRAGSNQIRRLPDDLKSLTDLCVLDVSHNRLEFIQPCLADVIARLYRFDYFNLSLRPRRLLRNSEELLKYLRLQLLLSCQQQHPHQQQQSSRARPPVINDVIVNQSQVSRGSSCDTVVTVGVTGHDVVATTVVLDVTSCHSTTTQKSSCDGPNAAQPITRLGDNDCIHDVTIGVVGEAHAGKSCLVEALKSERGLCKHDGSGSGSSSHGSSSYELHQIDLRTSGGGGEGQRDPRGGDGFCSAVVMATDLLDEFVGNVSVDLYLLVVDLTTLEAQRATQHLFNRHVNRLHMWLTALYEIAPDTPVLIVGTHAELMRSGSFVDVWRTMESFLDLARTHHVHRYPPTPSSVTSTSCTANDQTGWRRRQRELGGRTSGYHRHCLLCSPRRLVVRHAFTKLRPLSGGFVDLSFAQIDDDDSIDLQFDQQSTTLNGTSGYGKDGSSGHCVSATGQCSKGTGSRGNEVTATGYKYQFPHVVGFYEIDSKKYFPKDTKKNNISIDYLRAAIGRLARGRSSSSSSSSSCSSLFRGIPTNWLSFVRHLSSIKLKAPNRPCLPYDEVIAIARSFDIPSTQVPSVLDYFHSRGQLIFFSQDDLLSQIVVIDPSWLIHIVNRVMISFASSSNQLKDILQVLCDRELDKQLQRISAVTSCSSSRWLLAAMQQLDLCVPLEDSRPDQYFLFPNIIESGGPSQDVWPDVPDWDERQITCTVLIRSINAGAFLNLIRRVNHEGRRELLILSEPIPVFLSHHIVFFTSLDTGGCEDCYKIRRSVRDHPLVSLPLFSHPQVPTTGTGGAGGGSGGAGAGGGGGEGSASVGGSGSVQTPLTVAPVSPAATEISLQDEIVHKVLISLHSRLTSITVQVRGVSPCCTLKAVLQFLERYFDDVPDCSKTNQRHTDTRQNSTAPQASRINNMAAERSNYINSIDLAGGDCIRSQDNNVQLDNDDINDRELFLLCPKCVLLRQTQPERIAYPCAATAGTSLRRRAICSKWHNLGSWTRVVTGDYRFTSLDIPAPVSLTTLPDQEHPRLVLVLPPSMHVANNDWYLYSKMRFLEGFEVHFLCEYTGYWHMTDEPGYRLNQSSKYLPRAGYEVQTLLQLALSVIQCIQGVTDHPQNGRLIAPVIVDLIRMYDYLQTVDRLLQSDPCAWLTKHKERVIGMLTKVLTNASSGLPDAHARANNPIGADVIFQSSTHTNRYSLARFLRLDTSSGKFGALRPVYLGREVRWVCEAHYEELRTMPSK